MEWYRRKKIIYHLTLESFGYENIHHIISVVFGMSKVCLLIKRRERGNLPHKKPFWQWIKYENVVENKFDRFHNTFVTVKSDGNRKCERNKKKKGE